jgi:hypothetical protein
MSAGRATSRQRSIERSAAIEAIGPPDCFQLCCADRTKEPVGTFRRIAVVAFYRDATLQLHEALRIERQ